MSQHTIREGDDPDCGWPWHEARPPFTDGGLPARYACDSCGKLVKRATTLHRRIIGAPLRHAPHTAQVFICTDCAYSWPDPAE